MAESVMYLETDLLQPNPLQPRGVISPESLVELIDSIREHGILEPIVVAHTPAGYQIIAGERRWRASKASGLARVPVIVKETTPQGMLEMAIVENVQRIDLNPLERAQAYYRLMNEFGLTNQEVAQKVGKSPSYISNTLRLLQLPDALKDGLLSAATSEGHVRALSALGDSRLMVEAYKVVLRNNLSVRGTEELVRNYRFESEKKKKVNPFEKQPTESISHLTVSPRLDKMQKGLSRVLMSRVKITQSRVQAKIVVMINGTMSETNPILDKMYEALTGQDPEELYEDK
ncbi:MAG: ParB/RepB/Spo0J family partition protein [bacterium]|nr:ParB/RepB/Spo0J family partition protein [bacterium]